jgi:hypothetical protein
VDVYLLDPDADRYANLTLARSADVDQLLEGFDGRPMRDSWSPLEVEIIYDSRHAGRPACDFPLLFGPVPVLSERAAGALGDLIEKHGELLPLRCEEGRCYAVNVTRVVDALDESRSELKRFPSSGRVMRVLRYEFDASQIRPACMFKVPQMVRSDVYVTDRFRDAVRVHELTGLAWGRCLWTGD